MPTEKERLEEDRLQRAAWKKWGPYLSERQWGTVREDYSPDGNAWNFFTHDHARSRAYRWGENGLAGISDDQQRLCFSLALWNGQDPILKERLEFLSPYGIRSLSKFHEQHPYILDIHGQEYRVDYLPGESNSGMFGGNSNWRGLIWMPVNVMILRALLNFYLYYGDNFKIECPTGSGKMMNLFEVSKDIADRLSWIFLRDERGRRPVYGGTEKFQSDSHWHDHLLFYEYFHGDNGSGLGASHQTGWTELVAKTIQLYGSLDAKRLLEGGKRGAFKEAH